MSGSSTRDWLLDKLLKLRQAMTELKLDYEQRLAKANEERDQARLARISAVENYQAMAERVAQMAPNKQFKVVYRGSAGNRFPLNILAVNSSNGETVITVERSE